MRRVERPQGQEDPERNFRVNIGKESLYNLTKKSLYFEGGSNTEES